MITDGVDRLEPTKNTYFVVACHPVWDTRVSIFGSDDRVVLWEELELNNLDHN